MGTESIPLIETKNLKKYLYLKILRLMDIPEIMTFLWKLEISLVLQK